MIKESIFILIVVFMGMKHQSSLSVEFENKYSCEEAGKKVCSSVEVWKCSYACVEKGITPNE